MVNFNIYYRPERQRAYIVGSHYSKSLAYIKQVLDYAKNVGLTLPEDEDEITVEVLAGQRYRNMLSVEFKSKTKPQVDFHDLDKYPHMFADLLYA